MPNEQKNRRPGPNFLTIRAVADELGISERSVWRLVKRGEIVTHCFGAATRVAREELNAYIERSRRPVDPSCDHGGGSD